MQTVVNDAVNASTVAVSTKPKIETSSLALDHVTIPPRARRFAKRSEYLSHGITPSTNPQRESLPLLERLQHALVLPFLGYDSKIISALYGTH